MNFPKLVRSKFVSANLTLALPTFVRLLLGLAKTKTSAVILGTAGVGVVGVGSQLQMLGVTFGSLSIASSFIRQLSGFIADGNRASKRDLLGTAFTVQLILNGFMLAACALFIRPLAHWTFGNDQDFHFLLPIVLTIPLQSLMAAYLNGIFYSHDRLDILAKASVIAAVVEAATYILLVRKIGVAGAFWGVTIGMATWVSILTFYALQLEAFTDLFHLRLRRDYLRDLLSTGLVMTLTGGVTYLANTLIRVHITHSLGAPSAGIYQVVMALTAYYLPYLTNGIWGRLFPKICAGGLNQEGKAEWTEALVLTALMAAGVEIALMVVAGPLVSIFYSREFLSAIPLTPIQFLGDLFYLIALPTLGVILGLNRMRLYLLTWVIYYGTFYGMATVLTGHYGLQGPIMAYFFSNIGLAIFALGFYVRSIQDPSRSRKTLAILLFAILLVSAQAVLCLSDHHGLVKAVLPVCWGLAALATLISPRARKLLHS